MDFSKHWSELCSVLLFRQNLDNDNVVSCQNEGKMNINKNVVEDAKDKEEIELEIEKLILEVEAVKGR